MTSMIVILLQGCSPVYKTNYIYHPVKSESAAICANQCLQQKQNCQGNSMEFHRQCEREAYILSMASGFINRSFDATGSSNTNYSTRSDILNHCHKQTEKSNLSCQENHKLCHENCGGEVTLQTVCIQYCDKK